MPHKLICIPGFLGQVSDFDFLAQGYVPNSRVLDLCYRDAPQPAQSWASWESEIASKLHSDLQSDTCVLIGYSMGARLALNILKHKNLAIKAAVLLSCHPGLSHKQERLARIQADNRWADKFESSAWSEVLKDWNQQEVFRESHEVERREQDFDRRALARALRTFSLGNQEAIPEASVAIPTLICWGEKDLKFKGLATKLSAAFTKSELCEIPESGHRAIFDNPDFVKSKIVEFLSRVPC